MSVVFNRDTYDLPLMLFEKLSVERGYVTWRHAGWRTDVQHLDGIEDVAFRFSGDDSDRSVRLDRRAALALVSLDQHSKVDVWLAAIDEAHLLSLLEEVRTALPVSPEPDSHEVPIRFWTMGNNSPDSVVRNVATPTWAEIRANYSAPVVEVLDRLMARKDPPSGGQLMLWHGPPGTGKTHAIRALAEEWRDWVRPEYVVDPEAFFGGPASYIMSLLLGNDESRDEHIEKWRLLIFEDTGELVSADAKERIGQGLSRLLNTVDGLLGQGLKVLILMTTNDEIGRLHPAVSRPGRCSINLRLGALDREHAAAWLESRGLGMPQNTPDMTLAELFAVAEGNENVSSRPQPIGFGTPTP